MIDSVICTVNRSFGNHARHFHQHKYHNRQHHQLETKPDSSFTKFDALILVTVSPKVFDTATIGVSYELRWQVEPFIKRLK